MYCEKIKSIKKIGKTITYDLHTPKYHNFLLDNGVLSHNSGKSWGMLRMAYEIDRDNFKLEGNLFFKAGEMMRSIRDYYEREDITEEQKEGKIWMLDEAGIDLNNMKYFDEINKGLNAFFQTARHRNYIFFMTVPFMNFVSKGVRTLMTAHFNGTGYKNNKTILVPRILEFNGDLDYFFRKRLLIESPDGHRGLCNDIKLSKPPKQIVEEYEQMKKEFTKNLFTNISDKIDVFEEKNKAMLDKNKTIKLSSRQQQVVDLLKQKKNVYQIADDLDISFNNVQKVMQTLANTKQHTFEPIKNKSKVMYYRVYDQDNPPPVKPPSGFLPPEKAEEQRENLFDKKKSHNYTDWN